MAKRIREAGAFALCAARTRLRVSARRALVAVFRDRILAPQAIEYSVGMLRGAVIPNERTIRRLYRTMRSATP